MSSSNLVPFPAMSLVDKFTFEKRGARGVSDSHYAFALTSCCERVGVIDEELQDFYWNPDTPSLSISLLEGAPCPSCGAPSWELHRIRDVSHVPDHWRWACGELPRPGSRRVRPLVEHVAELVAFCRRVAPPVPAFASTLFFEAIPGRVDDAGRWKIERDALLDVAAFEPRFTRLLLSGYPWVQLSACGVFRDALVVAVELPREPKGVPAGLTSVKYAAPSSIGGAPPTWEIAVVGGALVPA